MILAVAAETVSGPPGLPNSVKPPLLLVMVADAADDWSPKIVAPWLLLLMFAVPALVCATKNVPPLLLSMVALPAVLISVPPGMPNTVTPPLLVILALP